MSYTVFRKKAPIYMRRLMQDISSFDATDAAAVLGNAGHESGGLTKLQEIAPTVKGSRGGYGWFQWTGPRRRAFEKWCSDNNLRPHEDEANYRFLLTELRGPERAAVPAVNNARGLHAKVKAFEKAFERAGVKHYDSRNKWAEIALEAFNKTEGPPPPDIEPVAPPAGAPEPPKKMRWWEKALGWVSGAGGVGGLGLGAFADWKVAAIVVGAAVGLFLIVYFTHLLPMWRERRKR